MRNKPTVVHSNELIASSYKMSLNELRLINLACSKVDSRNTQIGNLFISNVDFEKTYGLVEHKRTYEVLKSAADALSKQTIVTYYIDEKGVRRKRTLNWLAMQEYEVGDSGAGVTLRFSSLIEPYLFELKQRFTSLNFEYVAKLDTPFSFRLYQWLKESEFKANEHKAVEVILELDWMKQQAQIQGAYEDWRDFNARVIKPAVERINQHTDLSLMYDPVYAGRKINAVRFYYVNENEPLISRPLRPRLHRRPKVAKGSHEEGVWMRKNLDILMEYAQVLKDYDPKAKMDLSDLRKMAEYASIYDHVLEQVLRKEIAERTGKGT